MGHFLSMFMLAQVYFGWVGTIYQKKKQNITVQFCGENQRRNMANAPN